jgi:glutamate synthase domain-containing protein 1
LGAQERCRCIVEQEILAVGHSIYGWRQVPVDIKALGTKAIATRPEIEQIMFSMPVEMDAAEAERQLYLVRRRIEKAVIKHMINDFYLCSLSSRSIIYKGMFLAEQVTAFSQICSISALCRLLQSIISAIRPTPCQPGNWRSHSAFWRIMVKSIPSGAIKIG